MWHLYCYKKDTTKRKFTRKCRQIIHNCYCRNFTLSLIWFLFYFSYLRNLLMNVIHILHATWKKPFQKVLPVKKIKQNIQIRFYQITAYCIPLPYGHYFLWSYLDYYYNFIIHLYRLWLLDGEKFNFLF